MARFKYALILLVKSIAFWKAAIYIVAAVIFLYRPEYVLNEAAVLALVLAILKIFDITPELRARGLIR